MSRYTIIDVDTHVTETSRAVDQPVAPASYARDRVPHVVVGRDGKSAVVDGAKVALFAHGRHDCYRRSRQFQASAQELRRDASRRL